MRANTLAPEGIAPVHWSTPDKTPHKAMWLWDSCFHAIGRALVEPGLGWEFLEAMLLAAAPDGHVPIQAVPWTGSLSGDTQPPLLALATAYVRTSGGVNDTALAWALPRLERYIEWDFANRDQDGDGLLEWNHGTESGLDNSPLWDGVADTDTLASTDFSACVWIAHLLARLHACTLERVHFAWKNALAWKNTSFACKLAVASSCHACPLHDRR
jgi:putative isomerase